VVGHYLRPTAANGLVEQYPDGLVVLLVDSYRGARRCFSCEERLVAACVETGAGKLESCLFQQLTTSALFDGLAWLTGAGWRRPGPVAVEAGWSCCAAMQEQHLDVVGAVPIDHDGRSERRVVDNR
jgi:hypothetical protein